MSIEQALANNTAAVQAQTAAIQALAEAWNTLRDRAAELSAKGHSAATVQSAGVPQADTPAIEARQPDTPAALPGVPAPSLPAEAEPTPAAEPVSLETVKELIGKAAVKDREAVVAALGKFGVKRGSDLAEADRPAFLAEIAPLLEEAV